MDIKKVNSINAKQVITQKNHAKQVDVASKKQTDSITLTKDAKTQALYQKAMQVISKTPDIRADKIEAARNKLDSFGKPSKEMLDIVAKKILKDFTSNG